MGIIQSLLLQNCLFGALEGRFETEKQKDVRHDGSC